MNTTDDLLFRGEHPEAGLPQTYPEDGSSKDPAFIVLLRDNYWHFVGYSLALIIGVIALVIIVKYYLKKRCGIDCCVGEQHRTRHDAAMAAQLQRELDEEARREGLAQRRKDRREQMEKVLGEATLVVREEDLEHQDVETGVDHAAGCADPSEPILCVSVPSNGLDGGASDDVRRVPGRCAVCIGEYSVGDKVIFSPNRNCIHVFHDECILSWLSRGKKRCPCCRYAFIKQEGIAEVGAGPDGEPGSPAEATDEENAADAGGAFISEDSTRTLSDQEEEEEEDALVLAEIIERRTAQDAAAATNADVSIVNSAGSISVDIAEERADNMPPQETDRDTLDGCEDCAPQSPIERSS